MIRHEMCSLFSSASFGDMDPDHESLDFVSVRLKKLVDMVRSVNLPTFQSVSYLIIQKKALANVGYIKYPLVIFQVATENGPVEIVVFPMKIAWWIFPVRYVNVYQFGYPAGSRSFLLESDGSEVGISFSFGLWRGDRWCLGNMHIFRTFGCHLWALLHGVMNVSPVL